MGGLGVDGRRGGGFGRGVDGRWYWPQEPSIPPPYTAAREADVVVTGSADPHDDPDFVPSACGRVLDANALAHA